MADAIDMVELVHGLSERKRGRACIVMTHDFRDQKSWAVDLAQKTGAEYVDLLDMFTNDEDLSKKLQEYSVAKLFSLFRERATKPVMIVSGIEFLRASWSGDVNASEHFASRIETWQDEPALVFVMQYDKAITARPFRRFRQYTFVVDQRETIAL